MPNGSGYEHLELSEQSAEIRFLREKLDRVEAGNQKLAGQLVEVLSKLDNILDDPETPESIHQYIDDQFAAWKIQTSQELDDAN